MSLHQRARASRRKSGFNPTGANEYLAGATEQSVEVEFYGAYGASEMHATLYPIHRDREVVAFAWRPDGSAPACPQPTQSSKGNVQLLTYRPAATRGEAETWTATFTAADADGLTYHDHLMDWLVVDGVRPYDGRYEFDSAGERSRPASGAGSNGSPATCPSTSRKGSRGSTRS